MTNLPTQQYQKPAGVDLNNWRVSPYSRWAFQNVRQIIPTAVIASASAPVAMAEASSGSINGVRLDSVKGETLESTLAESFTDSLVVLHRGRKVYQWQAEYCDASQPHIVFSVSKSITAMLTGVLANQGIVDVSKSVVFYLPGCKGSAYEDCTVQQVLDMTVALDFEESYLDGTGDYRRYRDATGWNPVDQINAGPDMEAFIYGLGKADYNHGEVFHYKSPNSDLLGLLLERVAGVSYAQLLSSLIWQPMGAETDAYVTVDRSMLARGAGGICATTDDLARLGQLMLDRGTANGKQIIAESWVNDTLTQGDRAAWQKGDFATMLPAGRYRNKWYQVGNQHGCYMALGIHGQWLYINPTTNVVIAKMSSQPEPLDDDLDMLLLNVMDELSQQFSA